VRGRLSRKIQKMIESSILTTLKISLFAFVTLFPIVNPLGDAPIFLGLTHQYPQSVQTLLARKIAIYGFLILAASLILGTAFLSFFDISIGVVQIAGGLVLASTGWRLLNQENDSPRSEQQVTLNAALQSAFYPLTLPLTVGPGCISVSITIGAHLRQLSRDRYLFRLPLFLSALTGMALVCILVWLCYGNAGKLVKFLGPTGTTIVTRLSSFILMAIGVQIMCNGVSSVMRTRLPNAEDRISHLLSAALISPEHQEQDSRVAYPGQHEPVIGNAPYWPKETPPSILPPGFRIGIRSQPPSGSTTKALSVSRVYAGYSSRQAPSASTAVGRHNSSVSCRISRDLGLDIVTLFAFGQG